MSNNSSLFGNFNHRYNVTSVLDVDQTKCKNFPALKTASSVASLVDENDVVFTALPMPQHVKTVFEGEEGLLAGFSGGKVWIDHSTTDYEQTVELNEEIVRKGGRMLEAPVTGGLEALKKGQMTVFLAGDKTILSIVIHPRPHETEQCDQSDQADT